MRTIQSFVNRSGRLTLSQKQALENYWQQYGIDVVDTVLDFATLFSKEQPLVLEIGFGNGDSLIEMAQQNPHINYLGIDVYLPGVGRIIANGHKMGLTNLKVIKGDAVEIINIMIGDDMLSGVQLFFPDPWHKKRHHKRRLVSETFLELLSVKLKKDAFFHIATDWQDYAEQVMTVLSEHPHFKNSQSDHNYTPRPVNRPMTKFEKRGLRLGHQVWDIIFVHCQEK